MGDVALPVAPAPRYGWPSLIGNAILAAFVVWIASFALVLPGLAISDGAAAALMRILALSEPWPPFALVDVTGVAGVIASTVLVSTLWGWTLWAMLRAEAAAIWCVAASAAGWMVAALAPIEQRGLGIVVGLTALRYAAFRADWTPRPSPMRGRMPLWPVAVGATLFVALVTALACAWASPLRLDEAIDFRETQLGPAGQPERTLVLSLENDSWRDVRVTGVEVLGTTDLHVGPVEPQRIRTEAGGRLEVPIRRQCSFVRPPETEVRLRLRFEGGSSVVTFPRPFGYGC